MNELTQLKKDEAVTTSILVAEKFHKRHDKLIAEIERKYPTLLNVQNGGARFFFKGSYMNRGKRYPMYYMTRDGYALLVMGFTGKDALEWKLKFIEAFNKMESVLNEKKNTAWIETREQGKLTRRAETDVIQQLIEYAKAQGSKHAEMLYTTYSKLAKEMSGVKCRETATVVALNNLNLMETIIFNCIKEGMLADKSYKTIYQDCKARLIAFKDLAYLNGATA